MNYRKYGHPSDELMKEEHERLLDDGEAWDERKRLVEWLDNPVLEEEPVENMLAFYDDIVIENMAKALRCDPDEANKKFEELATAIETVLELKKEFYEILDV